MTDDDLSWHPAFSAQQRLDIKAGRLRASFVDGTLVLAPVAASWPQQPEQRAFDVADVRDRVKD
jgi:hypothetical protein